MAEIASLDVTDPPELWRRLGFVVDDGGDCDVGGVTHRLGVNPGAGTGVVGWALRGIEGLTELPVSAPSAPHRRDGTRHPNGVTGLDHVVVATPDLDRTVAAFETGGMRLRRTRDTGAADRPMRQAFFRVGGVVVEVVGPAAPVGDGPARFWGLAFTVADMEATAAALGDRLGPVADAVQPGRRIATVRRSAGSSVPLALMTTDPRQPIPEA